MKRILILAMSTVLALPIIFMTVAFAEEMNHEQMTTTSEKTETSDTDTTPKSDDASLLERLAMRKTMLKTHLTNVEKIRIMAKCQASQGLVSSVKGRIKGIETSRTNVHKNIIDHLTDLSTKLKNKGVDTTELDADIATLQGKIDTFKTDLAAYKQAVTDLAAMDCKTDPDGFKASLEDARADLAKVKQDSSDIRDYVKNTIKPLLQTIRAELETKNPDKTIEGDQ